MVQLQKDLKKIEAANIQVVGISYDPAEDLAKFAKKSKITFPLLSDPDSKAIKAYGILNKKAPRLISGIPYPGTFIVNKEGVIQATIFLEGYRERHDLDALLKAAKGKSE